MKSSFWALTVLTSCSSAAAFAQDSGSADTSDTEAATEYLAEDGGENPWPELSPVRMTTQRVRRAARPIDQSSENAQIDSNSVDTSGSTDLPDDVEPVDPIEDYEVELNHQAYLDSIEYVDDPSVKPPPGLLVVTAKQQAVVRISRGGSRVNDAEAPWQA